MLTGTHSIFDIKGCAFNKLDNMDLFLIDFKDVLIKNNCTIVGSTHYKFQPQGYTGVYLLAESHLSIHTYPEHGIANLDCFTCGDMCDPEKICLELVELLGAEGYLKLKLPRGFK